MKQFTQKILFIGCGNMGSALVEGLCQDGWHRKMEFHLFDRISSRAEALSQRFNLKTAKPPFDGKQYHFIFLAVKPKDLPSVTPLLENLAGSTIVSLLAGTSINKVSEALPGAQGYVRIMPNLCVEVGEAVIPVVFSDTVPQEHREDLLFLLASLGWVFEVQEAEIDSLTALSGSGPAFVALFIEAMMDGGVKLGIPWEKSLKVAIQTVLGSALLLKKKALHPGEFRSRVASPAGTTIFGLHALEEGKLKSTVMKALEVSFNRAKSLTSEE